jgi:predicted O-methyltransferase YrrM
MATRPAVLELIQRPLLFIKKAATADSTCSSSYQKYSKNYKRWTQLFQHMLHALTVFISAFLLFLVQPLIAKQILPWFGGTASVWTVCLVFFQLVLLVGYAYADRLSRLALRQQALVHTALLIGACAMLPVIPGLDWKPTDAADPTLRILLLLVATIGLPYMAVCTTGPLLQSWYARLHAGGPQPSNVYRLFALSNLASLVSLVMYPFVVEPFTTVRTQAWAWSVGFVFFSGLAVAAAWFTVSRVNRLAAKPMGSLPPTATDITDVACEQAPLGIGQYFYWLSLSALGTVLLLSVTTHITQDLAAVAFMWILPLALYLLTFVLCFDSAFWYRRWIFLPGVVALVPLMAWGLFDSTQGPADIRIALALFSGGLFVACMFLHGELARSKPIPAFLTRFYLMISVGGALGGLFVGLVAPRIFNGYWELPGALLMLGLLVCYTARSHIQTSLVLFVTVLFSVLAWFVYQYLALLHVVVMLLVLATGYAAWVSWRSRSFMSGVGLMAALATVASGFFVVSYLQVNQRSVQLSERNFYGTLRIKHLEDTTGKKHRALLHGGIVHGEQSDDERKRPTAYYGYSSGIGLTLERLRLQQPTLNIGLIGLGVGTLAAYGKPGDVMRYYEINPSVVEFAQTHFSYIQESSARVETVLGDARLVLEAEAVQGSRWFDLLVVDAFSSDSIPVHLMTTEAMRVYQSHLKPQGVIAFHVSNRHLRLAPVVALLAKEAGMQVVAIEDNQKNSTNRLRTSTYVLVTHNAALLADPVMAARSTTPQTIPGLQTWTDGYNNLLQVLK